MMGYDGGWSWGSWLAMSLMMVLVVVGIVWAVVLLMRAGADSERATPTADRPGGPEDILRERLARGEIDVAEYEARLTALGQGERRPASAGGRSSARAAPDDQSG